MTHHIIENKDGFLLVKTFNYGTNVLSKIVYESKTLKELKEALVPANAVGQEQISGLTGDPPVKITNKKKRNKLLRRIRNVG